MTTPADGYYTAKAMSHGTWIPYSKGMKIEVPIELSGQSLTAVAMLGDEEEKAERSRTALKENGWRAQSAWPNPGDPIRVQVKNGMYNGAPQVNVYIVSTSKKSEPVADSDLEKFLASERAKLNGGKDPSDPFG